MRVFGEVLGMCPFCKEPVVKNEPRKFIWQKMWRVAHLECSDNHTPINEPETFQ